MALLEVKGIKKNFGKTKVLKGIDFELQKGEVLSIIGSSGSGKTTLLRCVNFLEFADEGTISIDGNVIYDGVKDKKIKDKELKAKRRHFGLVFQDFNLFPQYSVLKNVTLAPVLLKRKQRVAIARALMLNPDILCFDEPTSALDPELTGEVLNVIKNLKDEGSTMIVVTHEMEFAKNVSDKIMFMADGVVEEIGTPQQIYENPQSEKTKTFLANSLEKF